MNHLAAHRALAGVVDLDHRLDDPGRGFIVLGGLEQRERILGEAAAAIARACMQELGADAVVHPDAAAHVLHIGADLLAQIGHLVDEGDLGREEGVGGVFDQLAGAPRGEQDRAFVEEQRAIDLAHHLAPIFVLGADDDAVGPLEVADRRAFAQEFGVGDHGKALGGAMGGFTTGRKEIIELLRQRSRPYLFSNSLAPSIVGASIAVFDLLSSSTSLRDKLEENIHRFKAGIKAAGFDIKDGDSAIVPVMLYDAKLSQVFADRLLQEGIYVIGFFFPVVPRDQARIRVQLSAAHEPEHIDRAIAAFTKVGKELGVIS